MFTQITDTISKYNDIVNNIIWGAPMIILLMGVGIYFSIRLGFFQVSKIGYIWKHTIKRIFKKSDGEGDIPSGQAALVGLAGIVGSGNIAGVATAVASGGPGALFWMWVAAFFGMATKFAEIALGIKYRQKEADGTYSSGPMKYLRDGVRSKFLAGFYCVMAIISYIVIVAMVDTNTIVDVITAKAGTVEIWGGMSLTAIIVAAVLVIIVGMIIFGGIKRLGNACEIITPIMGMLYIVGGLVVIFVNIKLVPSAFATIIKSAFTGQAAFGGFMGASITQVIRYGMARGMYSNEAGLGSAAVTHASAQVDHPVQQAIWAPIDIFLDTMVVNTITGVVVVMSGLWGAGADGAALTMSAFEKLLGGSQIGGWVVLVSAILFGFTCLISTSYICEQSAAHLFGMKSKYVVRILWLMFIVIGALTRLELVWNLADTVNGFIAIPNLLGLIILSGQVVKMKKEYFIGERLKQPKAVK